MCFWAVIEPSSYGFMFFADKLLWLKLIFRVIGYCCCEMVVVLTFSVYLVKLVVVIFAELLYCVTASWSDSSV